MTNQHKIEQLEKALYILLEACDFEDVVEVGGEPLEQAIENANKVLKYVEIDSKSDEPNGQDPDGTTDLGLEPIEEEWNDEEDWCDYCQMDVEGDEAGNCPHCGYLVTLIEETDYLEEDDE